MQHNRNQRELAATFSAAMESAPSSTTGGRPVLAGSS
jgi:hypothetical protein